MLSKYRINFIQIATLAYPIIIGQIGVVLMGVADVVMIGKIDSTNLAAAGLANSIFFLIIVIGIGTLMAISALTAQAKGAGHNDECAGYFRNGLISAVILSIGISAILYFTAENMDVFKQESEVTHLSKGFLHLLNAGTFPLMIFMSSKQFSDGLSITKPSAVITIIALLLNILLNWILIWGKWGFPEMGLYGAGVATLISRIFMALCMLGFILINKNYKHFIQRKEKTTSAGLLVNIFRIGIPSGLQYFFEISAFSFAGIMIGWIGKNEQAAHHIALNVASVTYMIATGISAAGSILVGDALGRKNKPDIIRSGKASLLAGALFMGSCAVFLLLFRELITGFYVLDVDVNRYAMQLITIAAFFQLSDGIQCVSLGILRGIGDTKIPTGITIIAYWIIGIPFGYLLAFYFGLSLSGIWIGLLAGLTSSALMLSRRFMMLSQRIDVYQTIHSHSISASL